jgi:hypothetical protein
MEIQGIFNHFVRLQFRAETVKLLVPCTIEEPQLRRNDTVLEEFLFGINDNHVFAVCRVHQNPIAASSPRLSGIGYGAQLHHQETELLRWVWSSNIPISKVLETKLLIEISTLRACFCLNWEPFISGPRDTPFNECTFDSKLLDAEVDVEIVETQTKLCIKSVHFRLGHGAYILVEGSS